ncbi:L,D-transpeptidase family protein [Shewanella sp. A25]|nr:L,D-transpeptidase family protein [Shewanella shenzhenensis]
MVPVSYRLLIQYLAQAQSDLGVRRLVSCVIPWRFFTSFHLQTALTLCFIGILSAAPLMSLQAAETAESQRHVQTQFSRLKQHTLLLALGGVNPVFEHNYRRLLQIEAQGIGSSEFTELKTMSAQIDGYWRYIASSKVCVTKTLSRIEIDNDEGAKDPLATLDDTSLGDGTTATNLPPESQSQCESRVLESANAPQMLSVIEQLQLLINLDTSQQWATLTLDEKITPGMDEPLIPEIAYRLELFGYLPQHTNDTLYSDELVAAIKAFQWRHGLDTDGVIGRQTLYWLNQSPMMRAELLAKNTLRQQIVTLGLNGNYLLINIPGFSLQLVEQGNVVLNSKVIVGKPSRPTPILDSLISNVVMNPRWHVPRSIIRRDIVPHILADAGYLYEREFDMFNPEGEPVEHSPAEWQRIAASGFPYRLVQRPGPKNALGKFKFHFENSYSIYLHGTSEPKLFNKTNRALSSGCIRVERVDELAQWFKTHSVIDTRLWDKLLSNDTQTQWFALSNKVPVHLVYLTAWLDEQGQVQFRNDIYQLEAEFTNSVSAGFLFNP